MALPFIFSKSVENAYAHRKDNHFETFLEHVKETQMYFDLLVSTYDIRSVFAKLFEFFNVDAEKMYNLVRTIVVLHDIGKLSVEFQNGLKNGKVEATHSDIGFYTLLSLFVDLRQQSKIDDRELLVLSLLSTAVLKHHSSLDDIDMIFENAEKISSVQKERVKYIMSLFNGYSETEANELIQMVEKRLLANLKRIANTTDNKISVKLNSIEMFLLFKLVNSLLITSDFLATVDFMEGIRFEPSVITNNLVSRIESKIQDETISFNRSIDEQFENLIRTSHEEVANINHLRSVITAKVEEKFLKSNKNVFFVEIPTGGGKTNISLRLIRSLLKSGEMPKKVFYVLPFINIIEQTFDYFSKFVPHEAISRFDSGFVDTRKDEDSKSSFSVEPYETELKYYYNTIFLNFPFVFTTHVGFFDAFFRNSKSENFNFYQLANSVVVLDEIQAYNPKYWNALSKLFFSLAKYFNTKVIVMSATLPSLQEFVEDSEEIFDDLTPPKEFTSHVLFKRTDIEWLDTDKSNLTEFVVKKMLEGRYRKGLVVFNTIKDSLSFYRSLNELFGDSAEILLLNSTIPYLRKKKIIEHIKAYDDEHPLILVSTQAVEAGVDLDFDIGFRAFALLDSIIQVAGRVNRNGKKAVAKLYVFNDESWSYVYKGDPRTKILKDNLKDFTSKEVNIDSFYDKTIELLKKQLRHIVVHDVFDEVTALKFKTVDEKVKLIDGASLQLFIPFDISVEELSQFPSILLLARKYNVLTEKDEIISGKLVWKTFQSHSIDFKQAKEFSKLLNLFLVSLFNYKVNGKKCLRDLLKDELESGFYYAEDYKSYYADDTGLDVEKFVNKKLSSEYDFI
ncbi:MAG: CRISPR-associated helicase Cas3' [Fervidobacterium sp.]|uniref:CRISPR-associated helicase Cas3' n=1 Tax=Fervidobacterium sp. TaxID=1871331 RepID=UPI00309DA73B